MELRDETGRVLRDIPEDSASLDLSPHPSRPLRARYGNVLEVLRRLPHLKTFMFDPDYTTQGLEVVRGLTQLTRLEISQVHAAHDLSPIATCTGLKRLGMSVYKADVSPLAELRGLEDLALSGAPKGLSALGVLQELVQLQLNHFERLSLKPFTRLARLQRLFLVSSKLTSFDPIKAYGDLRLLDLRGSNLTQISDLPACPKLEELWLNGCQKLKDLEGIERFPSLLSIEINELQEIASLHPILGLPKLKTIRLAGTRIADGDFAPLRTHPTLEEIVISEQGKQLVQQCTDRKVTLIGGPTATVIARVGEIEILKDSISGPVQYRIDQDLAGTRGGGTNHQIEDKVKRAVAQQASHLSSVLEFDSEGERLVIRSSSLEALQLVAKLVGELQLRR
jgi:hypothetical protein